MKNKITEKHTTFSALIFCANVVFSIIGVAVSAKLASKTSFVLLQAGSDTKLMFANIFVVLLLGFSYFCGVIAAMSPIFCFVFSFFNAFSFFISICNCNTLSHSVIFATFPLCLSLIFFCLAAYTVCSGATLGRSGRNIATAQQFYILLRHFVFSALSLLLMLSVFSIIQ